MVDPYLLSQAWQYHATGMMEPVTLKIRQPSSSSSSDQFASYTVFRAIRKVVMQSAPTSSNMILSVDKLDWLIFQEALSDAVDPTSNQPSPCPIPNKDDQLVITQGPFAGTTWTITEVSREIDSQAHLLKTKMNV